MRTELLLVLGFLSSEPCFADGGALLFREPLGERVFSVFTSPARLSSGPVEISVLVEGGGGVPSVGDSIGLAMTDNRGTVVSKTAIWGTGGNREIATAQFVIPHAGPWRLSVQDAQVTIWRTVDVAEAPGRFVSHWRVWAFVPLLLALFLWNQWLSGRTRHISRSQQTFKRDERTNSEETSSFL